MFKDHPEGLLLNVRVQPKASKNAIRGVHGDALKLTLTAPPVDGAANRACIAFLAKHVKLAKGAIEILSGQTSRNKRLLLRVSPGPDFASQRKALKKKLTSSV